MTSLSDRVAMARRSKAFSDVAWERVRQDAKWGEQNHPDLAPLPGLRYADTRQLRFLLEEARTSFVAQERHWQRENASRARDGDLAWDGILLEEVFEALAAVTVHGRRAELVQVAATALAWVEAIDRRTAGAVREALGETDGTLASAVSAVSGLAAGELADVGGVPVEPPVVTFVTVGACWCGGDRLVALADGEATCGTDVFHVPGDGSGATPPSGGPE